MDWPNPILQWKIPFCSESGNVTAPNPFNYSVTESLKNCASRNCVKNLLLAPNLFWALNFISSIRPYLLYNYCMIELKSFYHSLLRESFSSIFPLCFDCGIHIRIFSLIENLKFNFKIADKVFHFKSEIIIFYISWWLEH